MIELGFHRRDGNLCRVVIDRRSGEARAVFIGRRQTVPINVNVRYRPDLSDDMFPRYQQVGILDWPATA